MTDRLASSFRDPAGHVFKRNGVVLRQVNKFYLDQYQLLMKSGLYQRLVDEELLVEHTEVDEDLDDPSTGAIVIHPEQLPFISYPYEWCPSQLKDAAIATLRIQQIALEYEMTLRDASAYNIVFHRGRPVMIDTLSFDRYRVGQPWIPYGQFCQHFLAPLALARHVDVRLIQMMRDHIDGVPLTLAAAALKKRSRLSPGLGMHIRAHAAMISREATSQLDRGENNTGTRSISKAALSGLIGSLLRTIEKQSWEPPKSAWRDYYARQESYSDQGIDAKTRALLELLGETAPKTIWDIGANTGHFSRLAADATGALVIAIEMDPSAVELHWRECRRTATVDVLPLLNDIRNPSPSLGWDNSERDSLLERGPADLSLALAVVHHIAIGNNVPLPMFSSWLSQVAHTAIVEWVPKHDPMVQRLLATREDIFADYTTEGFEESVTRCFNIRKRIALDETDRTLYLLDRR